MLVICLFSTTFKKWNAFVFGDEIAHPMLNVIVVIFGGTLDKLPFENSARILLTTFSIFCLVLRTGYLGALFIFLQSDGRMKEVQSLDEMFSKGFDLFMYESYADFVVLHENMKDRYFNRFFLNNSLYLPFLQISFERRRRIS